MGALLIIECRLHASVRRIRYVQKFSVSVADRPMISDLSVWSFR